MDVTLEDSVWEDVDPGTEALVERWLVAQGDTVTKGQALAEVVVVKANYEIVAPAAGTLSRILVEAEGTFGRGAPVAQIDTGT
jgi:pyruvate/2-oxoglutarate dehydrogenase complex dihydrolipoamide acyltransferase (E2) component